MTDSAVNQLAVALAALVAPAADDRPPAQAVPSRYVTVRLAVAITGYSEKAIRRKIEERVWLEGREWVRAPDGHILIDIKGYEQWVAKGRG